MCKVSHSFVVCRSSNIAIVEFRWSLRCDMSHSHFSVFLLECEIWNLKQLFLFLTHLTVHSSLVEVFLARQKFPHRKKKHEAAEEESILFRNLAWWDIKFQISVSNVSFPHLFHRASSCNLTFEYGRMLSEQKGMWNWSKKRRKRKEGSDVGKLSALRTNSLMQKRKRRNFFYLWQSCSSVWFVRNVDK